MVRNSVAGVQRTVNRWPAARVRLVLLAAPALLMLTVAAAFVIAGDFNGLYGQDAYAYYDYAMGPLRESLLSAQPAPRFYWPPGYPYLVAAASLMLGTTPLAGQLVSIVAGVLVALFTALLARELWPRRESARWWPMALLAGLFVAVNGQLWQSSVVVMSDTAALAAGTLGMLALARYGRRQQLRWLLLAAGALAWAVLTRWAYALVAVPAFIYALYLLAQGPRWQAVRHAGAASLLVLLVLGPVLAPALSGLAAGDGEYATFAAAVQIYDWHPLTALQREHVTADGLLRYRLPNGLYYAVAPARSFYFTPLIAIFIAPGLWLTLQRRTVARLLLLVGWPAMIYAFHAGTAWQNFRFTLAYLPPLAILAAVGVEFVWAQREGIQRRLLLLVCVAGLVWMAVSGAALTRGFIDRKHADLETVRWVGARVPADAHLLAFGLTLTLQHAGSVETHELYVLEPNDLDQLLAGDRSVYLLIDRANVVSQWAGRSPDLNYHWLRDNRELIEIGKHRQYTLFRVGR